MSHFCLPVIILWSSSSDYDPLIIFIVAKLNVFLETLSVNGPRRHTDLLYEPSDRKILARKLCPKPILQDRYGSFGQAPANRWRYNFKKWGITMFRQPC